LDIPYNLSLLFIKIECRLMFLLEIYNSENGRKIE
jgi:hypothetical protein